ncbi:MAG: helix-turn-helix domain-containing protein [Clostridia bacterium]|nr:helix-turn-helix domain-containing protein [Clostridia bacterium]
MKIKEFRKIKNISCRELAENVGVSLQAMQRYENGKANPSVETLINISKFLHVSIDVLVGNDAEIVDLSLLDEERKTIIKKVSRELKDIEVGQIIGLMKTFK